MQELLISLGLTSLAIIFGFVIGYRARCKEDRPQLARLSRLERDYRNMSIGNQSMLTLDDGKSWFNYKVGPNKEILIIGPADPKVIAEHNGWEALKAYVEKNGPIGSRPINGDDIKALEGAGLTVEKKK